ncbi:hypothetical protein KMT30_05915 [Streptomyces sp. IBSBF 2953]|nr:hypothetical protein [Streptomyces hayashii]
MAERLVIDCNDLRQRVCSTELGLRAVQEWFRVNGIEPADVPVASKVAIEDSAFGIVIRYTAYLRNADGAKYVDPDDPHSAASADRTALLQIAPPSDWLASPDGER